MQFHRFVIAFVVAGSLALGVGVAGACVNSGRGGEHHRMPPPPPTTTTAPVVTAVG